MKPTFELTHEEALKFARTLVYLKMAKSNSEALRLIKQDAVKIYLPQKNGEYKKCYVKYGGDNAHSP